MYIQCKSSLSPSPSHADYKNACVVTSCARLLPMPTHGRRCARVRLSPESLMPDTRTIPHSKFSIGLDCDVEEQRTDKDKDMP